MLEISRNAWNWDSGSFIYTFAPTDPLNYWQSVLGFVEFCWVVTVKIIPRKIFKSHFGSLNPDFHGEAPESVKIAGINADTNGWLIVINSG